MVTVTFNGSGMGSMYIGVSAPVTDASNGTSINDESVSYQMTIGNNVTSSSPWAGNIYQLKILTTAMTAYAIEMEYKTCNLGDVWGTYRSCLKDCIGT